MLNSVFLILSSCPHAFLHCTFHLFYLPESLLTYPFCIGSFVWFHLLLFAQKFLKMETLRINKSKFIAKKQKVLIQNNKYVLEIKTKGLGSTIGDVFSKICSNITLCVTSGNGGCCDIGLNLLEVVPQIWLNKEHISFGSMENFERLIFLSYAITQDICSKFIETKNL